MKPVLVLNEKHILILEEVRKRLEKKEDWICGYVADVGKETSLSDIAHEISRAISESLGNNTWLTGWMVRKHFPNYFPEDDYTDEQSQFIRTHKHQARCAYVDRMLDLGYIA